MQVTANVPSLSSSPSQRIDRTDDERAARRDQSAQRADETRVERPFSADALRQEGEARELQRVQRVDNTAALNRSVQNALQSYEQTQAASGPSEQGQLVGIDLFV